MVITSKLLWPLYKWGFQLYPNMLGMPQLNENEGMTIPQFGHLAMFWPWQMQTCAVCSHDLQRICRAFPGTHRTYAPNIWGIYRYFQHEVTQYAILGCGCSISVILPIIPYEHILALNNAIFPATYALQAPPFSHWGAQIGQLQLVQIDDPKARHRLLQRFLRMQTIGW